MSSYKSEKMEHHMDAVFYEAEDIARQKCKEPGNTNKPWRDFSLEHLQKRLAEEYNEYVQSGNKKELLDVINMACFTYIAHKEKE